jgi:hypothetical protein
MGSNPLTEVAKSKKKKKRGKKQMARKENMVTRTIKSTNCALMCVDTSIGEVKNIDVTLPRTYKEVSDMLTKAKEIYDTDTLKCVEVVDYVEKECLMGMPESLFIQYAHEIVKQNKEEN